MASYQLYSRLRRMPETATPSPRTSLQVVDVGRDDWQGFGNPVLTREIRTRLRSGDARMFILIAAGLSAAACLIPLASSVGGSIPAPDLAALARDSFIAVALIQLINACLIGPGIGAEVIAAEREQKTFEMLLTSQLTSGQILRGKMLGVAALLLLLISPSFPLLALVAFLHGVTIAAVIEVIAVLCCFIVTLSTVSVSISALAHSSVSGKWTAYIVSGLLFVIYGSEPWIISGANGGWSVLPVLIGIVLMVLWMPAVLQLRRERVRGA